MKIADSMDKCSPRQRINRLQVILLSSFLGVPAPADKPYWISTCLS
ncbi:hypothetical protein IVW58_06500 [Salmonella enterica subsp. enterica serovar Worthington]|nr:hypothetical protein [Salmonella enterica subsp. enterica serovar Worthington]